MTVQRYAAMPDSGYVSKHRVAKIEA